MGFRPEGDGPNYDNMKEQVTGELKRTFRPEFLNRIDDVIVFHALDRQHIYSIVNLMLAELAGKLNEFDLTISVSEAARNLLVEQGFDPTYGARPLRRAIQRLIEDEISEELLKGNFAAGEKILVDAAEGKFTFSKEANQTEA